jgi:hypothetical protein
MVFFLFLFFGQSFEELGRHCAAGVNSCWYLFFAPETKWSQLSCNRWPQCCWTHRVAPALAPAKSDRLLTNSGTPVYIVFASAMENWWVRLKTKTYF